MLSKLIGADLRKKIEYLKDKHTLQRNNSAPGGKQPTRLERMEYGAKWDKRKRILFSNSGTPVYPDKCIYPAFKEEYAEIARQIEHDLAEFNARQMKARKEKRAIASSTDEIRREEIKK